MYYYPLLFQHRQIIQVQLQNFLRRNPKRAKKGKRIEKVKEVKQENQNLIIRIVVGVHIMGINYMSDLEEGAITIPVTVRNT